MALNTLNNLEQLAVKGLKLTTSHRVCGQTVWCFVWCRIGGQHVLGRLPEQGVSDGDPDSGRVSPYHSDDDDDVRHAYHQRTRKAPDECVHGVVTRTATSHGSGQSQDAQLGDLQTTRCRLEKTGRDGKATFHRRSQATASTAHGRTSRLQVSTSTAPEVDPDGSRETLSGDIQNLIVV